MKLPTQSEQQSSTGVALPDANRSQPWPPNRDAAIGRLLDFVERAGDRYSRTRNHDHGEGRRDNVSGLSPYVRRRILSEAEIVRAVLQVHTLDQSEKFVQEVFWRTYWKGWLHLRPEVWADYRSDLSEAKQGLAGDPDLARSYQRALDAGTGIECFDSWVTELETTGYLHNHARMWFASIWIYTLRLPWVLGADFFYRHLLDADPASNTLSWRWVGGLHTPGKHYLARAENICRFTSGRFNPSGQLDETATALSDPRSYPVRQPSTRTKTGPSTVTSEARTGVLLTFDDLWGGAEESIRRLAALPLARAALLTPARLEEQGRLAADFSRGAMEDAGERLESDFSLPVDERLSPAEIAQWALDHELEQLVVLDPGVGDTSDQLDEIATSLTSRGKRLVRLFRQWDRDLYPHATAGFFRFKKQIPAYLRQSGAL